MSKNSVIIRLKLFLPIAVAVTLVVAMISFFFIYSSISRFNTQLKSNLELEVATIKGMLDREAELKQQQVKTNLNFAYNVFSHVSFDTGNNTIATIITHQISNKKSNIYLHNWKINNVELLKNHNLVDSLQNIFGGTVTIFQRCELGYVRISTNVLTEKNSRATGTYIPNDSEVAQALSAGNDYYGRAFVVNDWYTAAYKPIISNSKTIGAIYVGCCEKDLDLLKDYLYSLKIGISGYPMIFDKDGLILVHPEREGQFWGDSILFKQIKEKQHGTIEYKLNGRKKLMAFDYFPQYDFYVAAAVFYEDETREFRNDLLGGAAIIVTSALLIILLILYYLSTEKIYKFANELQKSKQYINTMSDALKESEEKFRKLFDSTGDDIFVTDLDENIIEINKAACKTLGFSREELLKMKISEIKSEKYKLGVAENRKIIFEQGQYTFESEHIRKDGTLLMVEFTSRVIKNGNETLILSVVRDISKRAEFERQILTAMIEGEERERQRFAREMHDGLGPLLSALKLYVNELNSISLSIEERQSLLSQCNELIDEAVTTTRTISNNLMPTVLQKYGLVKAVHTFCDKVNKTRQLNIDFDSENLEVANDKVPQLILFRIISELINNTIKHAKASNVVIRVKLSGNILTLSYSDDGVGFSAQEKLMSDSGGTGLKNIISRIKSINGNYSFGNNSESGFNVRIEIIV